MWVFEIWFGTQYSILAHSVYQVRINWDALKMKLWRLWNKHREYKCHRLSIPAAAQLSTQPTNRPTKGPSNSNSGWQQYWDAGQWCGVWTETFNYSFNDYECDAYYSFHLKLWRPWQLGLLKLFWLRTERLDRMKSEAPRCIDCNPTRCFIANSLFSVTEKTKQSKLLIKAWNPLEGSIDNSDWSVWGKGRAGQPPDCMGSHWKIRKWIKNQSVKFSSFRKVTKRQKSSGYGGKNL